jgi:hypothetical protein
VGDVADEITVKTQSLQAEITQWTGRLAKIPAQTDRHDEAYQRLVAAATNLIEYEQKVPQLRAEPARAATEKFVRTVLLVLAAEAAALAALAAIPNLVDWGWGWLFLLIPVCIAHGWGSRTPVRHGTHETQRLGTYVLGAGGALLAVVVTGLISAWFVIALLLAYALGGAMIGEPGTATKTEEQA